MNAFIAIDRDEDESELPYLNLLTLDIAPFMYWESEISEALNAITSLLDLPENENET